MAIFETTYQDSTLRADVLPLIEILTAKENWFLNNLGKSGAMSTIHQTQTDTLRTAASAAVTEAADYTDLARTTPTLVPNIVEIVAIPFAVTRTQQQVQHYHGQDELARQTTKALIDWSNATEFDLVRSTLVSGASGTAPKMDFVESSLRCAIIQVWKLLVNNAQKYLLQNLRKLRLVKENFVVENVMGFGSLKIENIGV